jgi:hypothetical protein
MRGERGQPVAHTPRSSRDGFKACAAFRAGGKVLVGVAQFAVETSAQLSVIQVHSIALHVTGNT